MDSPSIGSLSDLANAGHPFSIPWSRETRALMCGFDSAFVKEPQGPWLLSCPFDITVLRASALIPDTAGGSATYRDGMSTSSGSTSDHLSAAFGITVGYPFLNANATGQYDRDVRDNESVRHILARLISKRILTTRVGHSSIAKCLLSNWSGHPRPHAPSF